MNIRGLAGPYTVMGSNFAPGTTSADIRSAMEPVGGEMVSCKVVMASPTVIAEMVFVEKTGAECVIATFNNQKADGRILHIYAKTGPSSSTAASPLALSAMPAATQHVSTLAAPPPPDPKPYDAYRNSTADTSRKARAAEPEYQDGSYGFDAPASEGMVVEMEQQQVVDEVPKLDEGRREEPRREESRREQPMYGGHDTSGQRSREYGASRYRGNGSDYRQSRGSGRGGNGYEGYGRSRGYEGRGYGNGNGRGGGSNLYSDQMYGRSYDGRSYR